MSQQDTAGRGSAPGSPESGSRAWGAADIPDQSGRIAVITGGNSGIGLEAARFLAGRGARVVLACRDESRAVSAAADITASVDGAEVETLPLDLSALES